MLSQLGTGITSGHHLFIDLLLVAAAILVLIQAVRLVRGATSAKQSSDSDDSKVFAVGATGMLGLGLLMSATNLNQWVFTSAAVNQILRMQGDHVGRLLAFAVFLLLASVMVGLPLILYLWRPQKAHAYLEKVDEWINGSMRYVVTGILVLIGLYLSWQGGRGVMNYFSM